MEEKLRNAFEEIKMDDACQARILSKMQGAKPASHKFLKTAALLAACIALIFMIFTNAEVVEALETVIEKAHQVFKDRVSNYVPGGRVEEEYVFGGGAYHVEQGKLPDGGNYGAGFYETGSTPGWLRPAEDGLYFVGDVQRIRVDTLISEETPFTYVYTDQTGITHYIAVGVVDEKWQGGFDGIGWAEWFRKSSEADQGAFTGWIGGYCTGHYNPETGEEFLWLQNAKEIMGVPWR